MNINLSTISTASFMEGLQNIGAVSNQIKFSGTLPATTAGFLVGDYTINFPTNNIISTWRINMPDADGDLSNLWLPMTTGSRFLNVVNGGNVWSIIFFVSSASNGRKISFIFNNFTQDAIEFSDFPINIFGHLYKYPWQ